MVFAALGWERRAVSRALCASAAPLRAGVWALRLGSRATGLLVETGIGPRRAREAALAAPDARAWVVMGCAGALAGWLRRGQGIAATEVLRLDERGQAVERLPAADAPLPAIAARHGVRVVAGPIAAGGRMLASAGAKAAAAASGALVVDMESGAIAAVARERGVPFHALRAVLDLAHERLPFGPDVVDEESGRVRAGRVAAALTPPWRWPAALRLWRGRRAAARTLGALASVLAADEVAVPAAAWRAATA